MSTLQSLKHALRRRWAAGLAYCELHRLAEVRSDGEVSIRKTRRRGSSWLIRCGNLYLRRIQAGVEVLNDDEWLKWEQAIRLAAAPLSGLDVRTFVPPLIQIEPRGLLTIKAFGRSLFLLLRDSSLSLDDKLKSVGMAAHALRGLHQIRIDWGDGELRLLSHGDATTENVVIDSTNNCAVWMDFDTRHRFDQDETERQADDLRALLISAAMILPTASFPRLISELCRSYPDISVLDCLRSRWLPVMCMPDIFRLAQAPLPLAKLIELVECCNRELPQPALKSPPRENSR